MRWLALPDLPVGLLAVLGVAVSVFPRQAECWRWWVFGSAVALFVIYLALVAKGRAADANRHGAIVADLGIAKASLARLEARPDLVPAAVLRRARRIRNELFGWEYTAKTATEAEWREIQEAYWNLRRAILESLDDLAAYDVSDVWLWNMRPELPLSDRGRLATLADKFDALVERFEKMQGPRA